MKKLLKLTTVAVLSVMALGLASCAQDAGNNEPEAPKVLDLRNKQSDGKAYTGRAAVSDTVAALETEPEFLMKVGDRNSFCKILKEVGGNLNTPADVDVIDETKLKAFAANVQIKSHEHGLQFEFTTPEDMAKVDFWYIAYVDGTNHISTSVEKDNAIDESGKLTVVYPLVNEGKEAKFYIQLVCNDDSSRKWEAQLYFSVIPDHKGLGCIDDLPVSFTGVGSDYMEIVDGHILKIKNTIPPMAKNLKRNFTVHGQDIPKEHYGEGSNEKSLGMALKAPASDAEMNASNDGNTEAVFEIDMNDYLKGSEDYVGCIDYDKKDYTKNYMFVIFNWSYTLDDYPGYTFGAPGLTSEVVENTVFKKAAE